MTVTAETSADNVVEAAAPPPPPEGSFEAQVEQVQAPPEQVVAQAQTGSAESATDDAGDDAGDLTAADGGVDGTADVETAEYVAMATLDEAPAEGAVEIETQHKSILHGASSTNDTDIRKDLAGMVQAAKDFNDGGAAAFNNMFEKYRVAGEYWSGEDPYFIEPAQEDISWNQDSWAAKSANFGMSTLTYVLETPARVAANHVEALQTAQEQGMTAAETDNYTALKYASSNLENVGAIAGPAIAAGAAGLQEGTTQIAEGERNPLKIVGSMAVAAGGAFVADKTLDAAMPSVGKLWDNVFGGNGNGPSGPDMVPVTVDVETGRANLNPEPKDLNANEPMLMTGADARRETSNVRAMANSSVDSILGTESINDLGLDGFLEIIEGNDRFVKLKVDVYLDKSRNTIIKVVEENEFDVINEASAQDVINLENSVFINDDDLGIVEIGYIEGNDLSEVLNSENFSLYMTKAMEMMKFMHSKGISQGDFAPNNIRVDANGDLYPIDFEYGGSGETFNMQFDIEHFYIMVRNNLSKIENRDVTHEEAINIVSNAAQKAGYNNVEDYVSTSQGEEALKEAYSIF
jgi:tRNA A-37 threonylcarbamoyl transferase component Bud32